MARPLKLTLELARAIGAAIAAGASTKVAAEANGVDEATAFRWLARAAENEGAIFHDFAAEVMAARKVAERQRQLERSRLRAIEAARREAFDDQVRRLEEVMVKRGLDLNQHLRREPRPYLDSDESAERWNERLAASQPLRQERERSELEDGTDGL